MKFEIQTLTSGVDEVKVGNVYHVKGGHGTRLGHMMVLLAITEAQSCLLMVVDKQGQPVGVTHYGAHYLEDRMPIAFCDGVADLQFVIRSL